VVAAEDINSPEAIANFGDADALMVTIHEVGPEIMDQMPKCKIICRIGTGMDAIDIPAATERGIWVTNVPDYSIDEVSTHAIALLLAQVRNLFRHRALSQTGTWRYQTERPIRRLAGQTLGILGLGRIGSASAKKGHGLGLNVIAHDPYLPGERFEELGVRKVDFDTLLRESDLLTLHVPLTDETRKIINAEALAKMKPTAFLANTARGDVVDIDALVEAVRNGVIAGAGIDVLPTEPPPPDHPVLHEEGIIVTPHIGWASNEAGHDVRERGSQEVVRVLQGNRPRYPWNEVEPRRLSEAPA
jgi:D-3-phosphoglycerate dehydrogenase